MNQYGGSNAAADMWKTMANLHPMEFVRFTGLVANEIATCVSQIGISTSSDSETLAFVLSQVFANAMARSKDPRAASQELPADPHATLLRDVASAGRRIAAPESDGAEFSFKIGPHAANAVLEGVDEIDYIGWSIYRSYLEVLRDNDPLPPTTESAAIDLFQSGLRISGWA